MRVWILCGVHINFPHIIPLPCEVFFVVVFFFIFFVSCRHCLSLYSVRPSSLCHCFSRPRPHHLYLYHNQAEIRGTWLLLLLLLLWSTMHVVRVRNFERGFIHSSSSSSECIVMVIVIRIIVLLLCIMIVVAVITGDVEVEHNGASYHHTQYHYNRTAIP